MALVIEFPEWPVRITHCAIAGPDSPMRFDWGSMRVTPSFGAGLPDWSPRVRQQAMASQSLWSCPGLTRASMPRRVELIAELATWIAGSSPAMTGEAKAPREAEAGRDGGAARDVEVTRDGNAARDGEVADQGARPVELSANLEAATGPAASPADALRRHWPEYLMEAAGLGLFMVSAGLFGTLLFHPGSPLVAAFPDPLLRRALMGVIMGLTAIGLIYSPWGQQSGAHLNPAVTLTFWRLGKVATWDAVFYVLAQFAGGALGVLAVLGLLGAAFADPPVSYLATMPGPGGTLVALLAETTIAFGLMTMVLFVTNTAKLMRLTGVFAGCLVALYITVEAPLSGMSMNPARTLASALPGGLFDALWIYFLGPTAGMLLAALAYRLIRRTPEVVCAKLNHRTHRRCIFRCGYARAAS